MKKHNGMLASLMALSCTQMSFADDGLHTQGFSISPMAGFLVQEDNTRVDDSGFGQLAFGYEFKNRFATELSYTLAPAEFIQGGSADTSFIRLDGLYHFYEGERARPYILFGGGHQIIDAGSVELDNSMINVGLGMKAAITNALSIRTELRAIEDLDNEYQHYTAALGLHYVFGTKKTDHIKPAEEPPIQDTDNDVDGVFDSVDQCLDTPPNTLVDERGCTVPVDSDSDGIADNMDQCPDTQIGAKVDASGCYIILTEIKEVSMNVQFENNSMVVKADSYSEIEKVANFLQEYPLTAVVIEGHTDDTGSAAYNLKLSQQRAEAVAKVLVDNFGIALTRVSAIGFGEAQPIVANDSPENRAKNRRVTAKVSAKVERIQK